MNTNNFEILLSDLYDIYNPSNKKEIPNIVKKYVGQEFDAVYYFLVKYNYSKHPNYNPNLNGNESIKFLLNNYNEGKRPLIGNSEQQPSLEEKITDKVIRETQSKINNNSELTEEIQKTILKINQEFISFKEQILKELLIYKDSFRELQTDVATYFDNNVKNKVIEPLNLEVKLNLLYTDSELNLPSEINEFNIGARFLVKDSENKLIALEIKDVFYDFITNEEGFIKEITIDKC